MNESRRHAIGLSILIAAIAMLFVGLLLGFASPANSKAVLGLVILVLAILLGVGIAAWFLSGRSRFDEPLVASRLPEIVIRCRSCNEVFAVEDSGERPLSGTCPHCGKVGTVKRAGTT